MLTLQDSNIHYIILFIYEAGQNKLKAKNKTTFCQCVSSEFNRKPFVNSNQEEENKDIDKGKPTNISRISLPIPFRSSKLVLAKFKFYKGDQMSKPKSYTQALEKKINKIIKIKYAFPKLLSYKISEIHKVINNLENKKKPKLNITTRGLSCKQIIILMDSNNIERVMA